jgi:hypothetical protein
VTQKDLCFGVLYMRTFAMEAASVLRVHGLQNLRKFYIADFLKQKPPKKVSFLRLSKLEVGERWRQLPKKYASNLFALLLIHFFCTFILKLD